MVARNCSKKFGSSFNDGYFSDMFLVFGATFSFLRNRGRFEENALVVGRPEIAIDHRQPHPGCYVSKVGMVEELVLEGFQTLGGGVQ